MAWAGRVTQYVAFAPRVFMTKLIVPAGMVNKARMLRQDIVLIVILRKK
jgi:hypothetical protein